jgi:phosphoserine phosphatase RsbU/P
MVTVEITFLQSQLEERKRRLEQTIALTPRSGSLAGLLREVDSALERIDKGRYGLCEECHEPVEQCRLMADPLVRYCLDHLTHLQRAALQRDLELAAQVQRNLLPQPNFRVDGWETSYITHLSAR